MQNIKGVNTELVTFKEWKGSGRIQRKDDSDGGSPPYPTGNTSEISSLKPDTPAKSSTSLFGHNYEVRQYSNALLAINQKIGSLNGVQEDLEQLSKLTDELKQNREAPASEHFHELVNDFNFFSNKLKENVAQIDQDLRASIPRESIEAITYDPGRAVEENLKGAKSSINRLESILGTMQQNYVSATAGMKERHSQLNDPEDPTGFGDASNFAEYLSQSLLSVNERALDIQANQDAVLAGKLLGES